MLNTDKRIIIEKRISEMDHHIESLTAYIFKIQDGMPDPDFSIEECNSIISDIRLQKAVLISTLEGID